MTLSTEASGGNKHDFSRQQFGGSVGGPVIKDKDFFFFTLERQRETHGPGRKPHVLRRTGAGRAFGRSARQGAVPTPYFDWRYNGRLDHHINDKNTIFLTYSNQNNNGNNDQATNQSDLTAGNTTTNQFILGNVTWNSVINDHIVNSFVDGVPVLEQQDSGHGGDVPYFTFPDGTNFGTNVNVPQQSYQKKWQFKDDLSWTKGNHGSEDGH